MSFQYSDQNLWTAVDRALEAWCAPADEALTEATHAAAEAGLPEIAVAPAQGRLLEVLARAVGARRVLEIGTLAGYSAIWLGRALPPDGTLITLEIDPVHAAIARENIDRAGLSRCAEVIVGSALESLAALREAGSAPFDLVFIDADKESCTAYVEQAIALSRPGTLIVVDNIVRGGRLIDESVDDASTCGVRSMMEFVSTHPRLSAAGVQVVGAKGYDGLLLAIVDAGKIRPLRGDDSIDMLLAHNAWATREVLRACTELDEAQWNRRFDIGCGSLHETLTHIVGAMFRWADRIGGPLDGVRPSIEDGTRRSAGQLLELLDAAERELAASAAHAVGCGISDSEDLTLGGMSCRFTRRAMLLHIVTHGVHHRAQCLNMLRSLGVPSVSDQLPDIDFLEWELTASGGDQDADDPSITS